MENKLTCKHCVPELQGTYLLPGPWKTLYAYYDHLGVDHNIIAKRHFYSEKAPNGEFVTMGEREDSQQAAERIAALKASLTQKKETPHARANK